jgi:hypothetical protein
MENLRIFRVKDRCFRGPSNLYRHLPLRNFDIHHLRLSMILDLNSVLLPIPCGRSLILNGFRALEKVALKGAFDLSFPHKFIYGFSVSSLKAAQDISGLRSVTRSHFLNIYELLMARFGFCRKEFEIEGDSGGRRAGLEMDTGVFR